MSAAENDPTEHEAEDPPLTVGLLADLQAGQLDDETAARIRKQIRTNQEAQSALRALNRVRGEVAAVTADQASAPHTPPALVAKISAALRSAGSPAAAHCARPRTHPAKIVAGIAGFSAIAAAIGLGTAALLGTPSSTPSTPIAEHITVSRPVSRPAAVIPLSVPQIVELLDHAPNYGSSEDSLDDPQRRASCLSGLGYPASTPVLGAQPIEINGRPAVVLLLPGGTPDELVVFAIARSCSAADTGLWASTALPRT